MFIFAPILNVSCPGLMGFTTIFLTLHVYPPLFSAQIPPTRSPEWVS